jgi:hypothetical protein
MNLQLERFSDIAQQLFDLAAQFFVAGAGLSEKRLERAPGSRSSAA